jgi:Na+-translocating ferredoxin:NAD+ oxidoreductase RnfC subunit
MPYLLNKFITHNLIDEAINYKPLSCIDCNLCTYVCPSKIPVASNIKDLKEKIKEL